ncbi:MAG TPA: hypothetical protein DCY86_09720 [Bdellovibrionales bacterium]|nr:hypothetical protein [Bdellovibrionales bacterium]
MGRVIGRNLKKVFCSTFVSSVLLPTLSFNPSLFQFILKLGKLIFSFIPSRESAYEKISQLYCPRRPAHFLLQRAHEV